MINKSERIRKEHILYGNQLQVNYVHLCKDCKCEMFKTASEEKTSSGYCPKCVHNHRKLKSKLRNEKGEKFCYHCKRYLHISKFSKNGSKGNICCKCNNVSYFGITSIDFENMLKEQNNKCKICGNEEICKARGSENLRQLAVDHCHATGKVRGLLCTTCNIGLGSFKDNINLLQKAINYLNND